MRFLKQHGWTIVAFAFVASFVALTIRFERFSNNIFPYVMLVSLWVRERKLPDHRAAKRMIVLSLVLDILVVMKVTSVEAYMDAHVGISGYGAAMLLIAPILIPFLWGDLKQRMAEEQAKSEATGGLA